MVPDLYAAFRAVYERAPSPVESARLARNVSSIIDLMSLLNWGSLSDDLIDSVFDGITNVDGSLKLTSHANRLNTVFFHGAVWSVKGNQITIGISYGGQKLVRSVEFNGKDPKGTVLIAAFLYSIRAGHWPLLFIGNEDKVDNGRIQKLVDMLELSHE